MCIAAPAVVHWSQCTRHLQRHGQPSPAQFVAFLRCTLCARATQLTRLCIFLGDLGMTCIGHGDTVEVIWCSSTRKPENFEFIFSSQIRF